jgi:tRNA(adenine34) deaminase
MLNLTPKQLHALMQDAMDLAHDALPLDVPVGALILDATGALIGQGVNTRERDHNPLGHAELNAMRQATEHLQNWRLSDCTLIVTLEPCAMCAAALAQARMGRIVYGASDALAGGCGGSSQVIYWPQPPEIVGGVLGDACSQRLQDYFKEKRGRIR